MRRLIQGIADNWVLLLSTVLFIYIYWLYVDRSTINIVFMDQFRFLPMIDSFLSGNLQLSDLWGSHQGHRTPGYMALVLLNAKLFGFNTIYETMASAITLAISMCVLYREYKKSLGTGLEKFSGHRIQLSAAIGFVIFFSIGQWQIITFSNGLYIFLKQMLFIIGFSLLNRVMLQYGQDLKATVLLSALSAGSILFFTGAYSPAYIGTMAIGIAAAFVLQKRNKIRMGQPAAVMLGSMAALVVNSYGVSGGEIDIGVFLSDPWVSMRFLLVMLGAVLVPEDVYAHVFHSRGIIVVGSFVLLTYLYLLMEYFRRQLYRRTWVPFLLMVYSFLFMGMTCVARIHFGESYGMQSRYLPELHMALVGGLWIGALLLMDKGLRRFYPAKVVLVFLILAVVVSQYLSWKTEWGIAPYRKSGFIENKAILMNIDSYPDEELGRFQSDPQLVREGAIILKEHNLNIYRDLRLGHSMHNGQLLGGWYSEEGTQRWISKSATGMFKSGREGQLLIQGMVPDPLDGITVRFMNGDQFIAEKQLAKGDFSIQLAVPANQIINLKINSDESFIPKQLGLNEDQRELCLLIRGLKFK